MDWSTVLTSTALSAVVGVLVSLAAVSQTTVRQRRAERRDEARLQLRALVAPLRAELRLYQLKVRTGAQRNNETSHIQDHNIASQVLQHAEPLSGIRRWLVRRRCGRVFGEYWATLAEEMPYVDDSLGSAIVPALFGAPRLQESGAIKSGHPLAGLYHRAYAAAPGERIQQDLQRELSRLARCW